MELIVLVTLLSLLGVLANLFGADSRKGFGRV